MRPYHKLALQYAHIPACLLKFPPPAPPPPPKQSDQNAKQMDFSANNFPSDMDTCEPKFYRKVQQDLGVRKISKASDLGLNEDSVTFLDEEDEGGANMIVCSNGNCKFLNTHFVLGTSNRYWGDGDPMDEGRCIHGLKQENANIQICKNPNNDNPESKKVLFLVI